MLYTNNDPFEVGDVSEHPCGKREGNVPEHFVTFFLRYFRVNIGDTG